LLDLQRPDGHWVGELQGDTILESEYVLLLAFLGREESETARKACRYILTEQRPEGGWSNYPDGPFDLSVSVKAYFALKLTGHDPESPPLRRARELIRQHGGAAACNSFTKFYLAFLGQFPYANCPSVPVELVLLPSWCYVNLYAMSSWTRTIVVPLSIFSACKPLRQVPPERGIAELFLQPPQTPLPPAPRGRLFSWSTFFLGIDRLYKWAERWGLLGPFRRRALRKADAWMRERFADSDGLGAIFPPMIYTVIALRCLGVADDAPEMKWAIKQLDDLMIEDGETIRLQPCLSPVWDTALTLNALAEVAPPPRPSPTRGEGERQTTSCNGDAPAFSLPPRGGGSGWGGIEDAIDRGARWLLEREVRRRGDWSVTNPNLEPGGWFFEYRNGFYPDTDDTAMVLMGLARTGRAARPKYRPAVERAVRWLVGMQNQDGGWAAFDRDINREVLTKVPFADHNAMLDPSCPDITARVLEALSYFGFDAGQPRVRRALAFLRKTQGPRGCWPGRWGVNYVYGTWQVLAGLGRIGLDRLDPMVRRAVEWLAQVQQVSGAWGESCRSYDDPAWAGKGEPTASQTAWAVLGLLAAGEAGSDTVRRGIDWLLATQQADGGWREETFTGTGFPKVFYLKYHLYSLYFPLMALARYQRVFSFQSERGRADGCPPASSC
jgi:squalene-hopene/tetraprenyl-beta-curcumene cyclase